MSHVCPSCATDLARARVRREPHYGLLAVVCPKCETTYPRALPPAPVRRRRRWRTPRAIALFLLQFTLAQAALGIAVFAAFIFAITDLIPWGNMPPSAIATQYVGLIAMTTTTGAWMTIALPHWSRGLPWLVLATITLCTTFGTLALLAWQQSFIDVGSGHRTPLSELNLGRPLLGAALVTLATLPGIPVGLGLRALWRWMMRHYRRHRRTQLRKAWA
jgi:hypothetical protein